MRLEKHNCETLELPNVFYSLERWEQMKQHNPELEPVHMDEFLGKLVFHLARENPSWDFYCEYSYSVPRIHYVEVRQKDEDLGRISHTSRGSKRVWSISNERIHNKLERGSDRHTSNFDKAVKIVKKEFGAKTIAELAERAHDEVRRTVKWQTQQGTTQFRRSYEQVFYHIVDYVMGDGFDQISEIALRHGIHSDWREQVQEAWENNKIRQSIEERLEDGGYVVVVHDGYYAVSPASQDGRDQITYYDEETLPAGIKRGVGMLKLAEDEAFVVGVGVRESANAFFILKELEV